MPSPGKYSAKLTRWSRGSRAAVAEIRRNTNCDVVWDFATQNEYDNPIGRTVTDTGVWARATTPGVEDAAACGLLDPRTGKRRG